LAGPDIFLSYNREDADIARRFAEGFEAQGFEVWWDQALRSGETYDEVTEAALRGAKAVVVLWSPRSVASHWVRSEATIAHRAKTLVPATIEPCDKPVMFELTQTADLTRWNGATDDKAWLAFLNDVRGMVGARKKSVGPPSEEPPSAGPSRNARPTLAVLPFTNRSGRPDDEVFAADMVEDVTMALSLDPWMGVVAASVTAAYRQGARDLRQIGRDLSARYLLEGNIRRAGENLRVTAQLVEAENGNILWTGKFDRPSTEHAELHEELVDEVAAHLAVQVERAEVEYALKRPSSSSAWEAFVRSTACMSRMTRSSYEAGIAEARRALEIDPNYGMAYAPLLANAASLWRLRGGDDHALMQEILDDIRKARELEPDHPVVLVGCANALDYLGRPTEALPLVRRAATTYPNLDYTRSGYGVALVRAGRLEEGLAEFGASERVGPNSWWSARNSLWRSVAYLRTGRLDQACEAVDHALLLIPESVEALVQSALCLAALDDWAAARRAMHRLREADPETTCPILEGYVDYQHGGSDKVDEYLGIVRELWEATEPGE